MKISLKLKKVLATKVSNVGIASNWPCLLIVS